MCAARGTTRCTCDQARCDDPAGRDRGARVALLGTRGSARQQQRHARRGVVGASQIAGAGRSGAWTPCGTTWRARQRRRAGHAQPSAQPRAGTRAPAGQDRAGAARAPRTTADQTGSGRESAAAGCQAPRRRAQARTRADFSRRRLAPVPQPARCGEPCDSRAQRSERVQHVVAAVMVRHAGAVRVNRGGGS